MSGFSPDLYDDQVQEGISWTLRQVGKALGADEWTEGDGTETVAGDVQVEIDNILVAAGLRCPETSAMATLPAGEQAGLLDAADKAHRACVSAWSCGEPYHRVKTMLDAIEHLGVVVARAKDTKHAQPESGGVGENAIRRALWRMSFDRAPAHDNPGDLKWRLSSSAVRAIATAVCAVLTPPPLAKSQIND